MSSCAVRWHRVSTDDPFTDPDLLRHHHHLAAHHPPLLSAYRLSDRLLGSEVHHQPPAGLEHHHTSRSVVAYGRQAGTSSPVQYRIIMYKEATELSDCSVIKGLQMWNNCWHKIKWFSWVTLVVFGYVWLEKRKPSHKLSHAECSSTGVDGLLAVACEGASPLPKTFLMTINGPSGISERLCFGSSARPCPLGSEGQQLLQQAQHLAER